MVSTTIWDSWEWWRYFKFLEQLTFTIIFQTTNANDASCTLDSYKYGKVASPPAYSENYRSAAAPPYAFTCSCEHRPPSNPQLHSSFSIVQHRDNRHTTRNSAPTHMAVSMVMLMVCFVLATPFSLLLTVPAYILADRVSKLKKNDIMYNHTYRSIQSRLDRYY